MEDLFNIRMDTCLVAECISLKKKKKKSQVEIILFYFYRYTSRKILLPHEYGYHDSVGNHQVSFFYNTQSLLIFSQVFVSLVQLGVSFQITV